MPVTVRIDHAPSADDLPDETLVVLGVRTDHLEDDAPGVSDGLATAAGFEATPGQSLLAETADGLRLLVGLGDGAEPDPYRKAGAAIARAARTSAAIAVDAVGHLDGSVRTAAVDALTQGLVLGAYRFDRYKDAPQSHLLAEATVVAKGGARSAAAVQRGIAVASAMVLVRDLVNTPGGDLTPKAFATRATKEADAAGLEIEVLEKAAIRKAKLGGLLGVNRGSTEDPRFVKLSYAPEGRPKGNLALVGKGVTFDSGGLSIKTATGMEWMKADMAGAATVLAVMTLVPTLAPKVAVSAYLPLTDNMLGGDATRVGDVLRARNGKTIEVLNTDAEGRLILADGLSMAAEAAPDAIIDVATLTGACMVGLGQRTAGIMSNHEALRDRVLDAAGAAGEDVWPLPMPEYLRKSLDSDVADLRNIGTSPYGGAMTAAVFLREFVDDTPWAHIDVAGPADTAVAWDENSKGGTGFGVRTLIAVLAGWSRLPT